MNPTTVNAGSPQTFYAHRENRGYEASDNQMDQRTPEPNAVLYSKTANGTWQMPGNNAAGGRYFTDAWPSAATLAAGTWTFHTRIWRTSGNGTFTYYAQVFKNADVAPIFTSGSATIPTVEGETDVTGAAPSISLSAGDRLRFEYWVVASNGGRTVFLRIDNNATPDTSTRVDTTVAQIVPTLGFWLLAFAGAFFVFVAVRKRILTPRLRGAES